MEEQRKNHLVIFRTKPTTTSHVKTFGESMDQWENRKHYNSGSQPAPEIKIGGKGKTDKEVSTEGKRFVQTTKKTGLLGKAKPGYYGSQGNPMHSRHKRSDSLLHHAGTRSENGSPFSSCFFSSPEKGGCRERRQRQPRRTSTPTNESRSVEAFITRGSRIPGPRSSSYRGTF